MFEDSLEEHTFSNRQSGSRFAKDGQLRNSPRTLSVPDSLCLLGASVNRVNAVSAPILGLKLGCTHTLPALRKQRKRKRTTRYNRPSVIVKEERTQCQ